MGDGGYHGPWWYDCAVCGERYAITNWMKRTLADGSHTDVHQITHRRRAGETVVINVGRLNKLKVLPPMPPAPTDKQGEPR